MPNLLLALLVTAVVTAQAPAPPPPDPQDLVARFARLDRERASAVIRDIERHLQRLDDWVLQGIMGLERGIAAYPERLSRKWLLPSEYAPVTAERQLVARGTTAHRRAAERMRPLTFLPDLEAVVVYDWQLGKAVRTGTTLDDRQRFANYARGYPPGADHALARLLAKFDVDAEQRRLAWYFEHLYADREGGVYEGITLFAAWHSGLLLEMPDTDAIAYARQILGTTSYVSPIPADARREQLYREVQKGFARHREYRSLRLAAAAAFLAAEPPLDPIYAPLVRRCHWLWVETDGDPDAFAERLTGVADRAEFLREIDAAIRSSPEVVTERKRILGEIAAYVQALARRELEAAGG